MKQETIEKEIFQNIVGYDDLKTTLKRTLDVLNNPEKYQELGATIPHGLFLYGSPGIGKTTISEEFMKHTNRDTYIIRKNKSNGDFIKYMHEIFMAAKANQPSLILLDDMDKFSECDNRENSEEYVAVQSLIDEIKKDDIFVIATANNTSHMPGSLLRSGRFDIQIRIEKPDEKDSYDIMKYYLKEKKLDKDVNIKNISYILNGSSCADLEKVCNQAGLYAGYKNQKTIKMDDLIRASLEKVYETNLESIKEDDPYSINIAYHEAGHALTGELLDPGSISFITISKNNSNTRGMTIYHNNDNYFEDIDFMKNRVKTLLAGKAATELVYKKCDTGANQDLHRAYEVVRRLVDNYCIDGFDAWYYNEVETSEKVKKTKDEKTSKFMSEYYEDTKEILITNREKLDLLATKLNQKKILFKEEIQEILSSSTK